MYSRDHSIKGPLIFIIVGTALIYLPSSIEVGLNTFWMNPIPYVYIQEGGQWDQFFHACFLIIQLIGVIAFIRGLIILSHLGEGHSGQGSFSKGLTHVIAGIFCINIYLFSQIILATLGLHLTS